MSLDLATLQLLKHREKYDRYIGAVPTTALTPQTQVILADFGRWLREFEGAPMVDLGLFLPWFKTVHPTLKEEAVTVYAALLKQVKVDIPEHIEAGLGKRWVAAETATKVTGLLEKWQAGEEIDLGMVLKAHVEEYEQRVDRKVKNPQVLDAIEDLLDDEENNFGIEFPWASVNECIKPMVGGDFIVLAARPDKGKTTACAQIATYAGPQIDKLFPGEKRSILWFNNEGPGKRIVTRTFQSALNATIEDMVALKNVPADPEYAKYRTMVRQQYALALGGRPGVLRIMDIHGLWNYEVEDLIRLHKPALIIFDMIDNIKFGGETMNNGQRTDQLLEAMYQWARFMGVKYDTAIIANSQLSADADGEPFPTLPQLKDSKTGKQGAADVIITMGAPNDPMLADSRYFGTTKNKKQRTGGKKLRRELLLVGDRARYVEAPQ